MQVVHQSSNHHQRWFAVMNNKACSMTLISILHIAIEVNLKKARRWRSEKKWIFHQMEDRCNYWVTISLWRSIFPNHIPARTHNWTRIQADIWGEIKHDHFKRFTMVSPTSRWSRWNVQIRNHPGHQISENGWLNGGPKNGSHLMHDWLL